MSDLGGITEPRRAEGDLYRKIQWLLAFRLFVTLIGLTLLFVAEGGRLVPVRAPHLVLFAALLLDIIYVIAASRIRDLLRFAGLQIAIDLATVTALAYLTGGVRSFATLLYFGVILAAGLTIAPRLSVFVASASTIAIGAIHLVYGLAEAKGYPPPFVPEAVLAEAQRRPHSGLVAYLVAQGIAFHVVASLSARLAQELRRVRILYDEILEQMAEGLVAVNARGHIVFVNGEACRLLRYRKQGESLVGRDIRDVFRRREDRAILDCLLAPEPVRVEVEVDMRDGTRKAVEVKTSLLRDEKGVLRGAIGIFTDLTFKKMAEAAEKRAERLEGISALAMGIAHEVRNPLASIRGCVQELGRLDYLGEDERQLARIVCRESDRLDAIVGDFLSFARMRPPELGTVDLGALLGEFVVLLRGRVNGGTGVVVQGPNLPAGVAVIRGDGQQLTQVFLNLGINALESLESLPPAAPRTVRVDCREAVVPCRSGEPALEAGPGARRYLQVAGFEVSFHDTGRGIAPDAVAKLFSPFYTTKERGTGLGLAVVDKIVKAHGGAVTVASEVGRGSTFRVFLPKDAAPTLSPMLPPMPPMPPMPPTAPTAQVASTDQAAQAAYAVRSTS